MSYELWTSPITGYRRRGTRFSELRALFERGISVTSVFEPLRCCAQGDDSVVVAREMKRLDFDAVGMIHPESERVTGYVYREDLTKGKCGTHERQFGVTDLISDSTPLADLIQVLEGKDRLFVLVADRVRGIATKADLQKPPVRVLLFGLVSLLEMHMSLWIRRHYVGVAWHELLTPGRLSAARKLMQERRKRGEELTELECLQFCDKRTLIVAQDDLREILALGSKTAAARSLGAAEKLRDQLAHSNANYSRGTTSTDIAKLVRQIELTLRHSDTALDATALDNVEPPQLGVAL